jgi:MSHA biogenesis protein MshN
MGGSVDWRGDRVIGDCLDEAEMSVINQVLNQLEQRGAHTAAEQTMVRAVPHARRNFTMPLLVFGLALAVGIAAWQWVQTRKREVAATMVQRPPVVIVKRESVVPAANLPASRLSFELSSVPLPSTFRQESGQATSTGSGQALTDEKNISENPGVLVQPAQPKVEPQLGKTVSATEKVTSSNSALPMKQVSAAQKADAEYRKAASLMQQGRLADAIAGYQAALRLDAGHDAARQALVALLLESKRGKDAERVLQDRLKSKADHTGFTMMLARLQVERGAVAEATATLEKALPYASSQADYQAFLAALLQRQNRNDEAIAHYQIVLQLAPNNGIWLMGYGISLQAVQRNADAKVAFQHALDTQTLSPDLQAFVRQKLKGL